jgi:hypothetical protein
LQRLEAWPVAEVQRRLALDERVAAAVTQPEEKREAEGLAAGYEGSGGEARGEVQQ